MVKEILLYECEICKQRSTDKTEIESCEQQGIIKLLPIGTIFQGYTNDKIVFAIIRQYPNDCQHHHSYSTWACRDPDANDTIGKSYYGITSWDKMYPPNESTPAYHRMIEALKAANITPINYTL